MARRIPPIIVGGYRNWDNLVNYNQLAKTSTAKPIEETTRIEVQSKEDSYLKVEIQLVIKY